MSVRSVGQALRRFPRVAFIVGSLLVLGGVRHYVNAAVRESMNTVDRSLETEVGCVSNSTCRTETAPAGAQHHE